MQTAHEALAHCPGLRLQAVAFCFLLGEYLLQVGTAALHGGDIAIHLLQDRLILPVKPFDLP